MEPIQCGPPGLGWGAATVSHHPAKPVFPITPGEDRVHLPFTKQTMPDRYPQPRGRIIRRTEQTGSITVSRPRPSPNQKKDPLRNMQTFGTTGKNLQHRLPQALRVWLHSLHSPAGCRRGQVQRGFINSIKSVANRGPQPQMQIGRASCRVRV